MGAGLPEGVSWGFLGGNVVFISFSQTIIFRVLTLALSLSVQVAGLHEA